MDFVSSCCKKETYLYQVSDCGYYVCCVCDSPCDIVVSNMQSDSFNMDDLKRVVRLILDKLNCAKLGENDGDIDYHFDELCSSFKCFDKLSTSRKSVLIVACLRLGTKKIKQFKRMWDAIEGEDFEAAAEQLIDSQYHTQLPHEVEILADIMCYNKI